MTNLKFTALLAATTIAITTPALAASTSMEAKHSIKKSEDGDVKETSSKTTTNAAGTTTKSSVDAKLDVDTDGEGKQTVTTESSIDPKGLGNKTKSKTKEVTEHKDGKTTKTVKKTVDGETVVDTKTERSAY